MANSDAALICQSTTADILDVDVAIVNPKRKAKSRPKPSAATTATHINQNEPAGNSSANVVNSDDTEPDIEEIQLKYGASHVIKLFLPVTLCILFVITSLTLITSYQKSGGANL